MTADATSAPGEAPAPATQRRREPFGHHVARTVADLQDRLIRRDSSAVATLARLRAAAGRAPGAVYTVLTVTSVPDRFFQAAPGDEPTRQEWAKHTALTLYAGHQQSVGEPMHVDGIGLGTAISRLARTADSPDAVRRRFSALGATMTYDATAYHVRALISLLRQHRIPLDYGALADDLVRLQWPGGHDRVRAQWGREFYRSFTPQTVADDSQE
ncbi:type I-E CRISPR-associated protein Cse2/CasB [Krasilnikovia sp. MM14-A1259]|uniref:type I-E CRISPR-associated protein Cse2/CasB n=1 Tax=Krasilnikovia sp. MM14-A1259 TaxID=3373539 RepID=UPI003813A954